MTLSKTKSIGGLALAASVLVSACGSGAGGSAPATTSAPGTSAPGTSAAAESMAPLSGAIVVSGSSTVEPISTAVSELFKQDHPDWNYQIEGPGTGDGFKRFCAGETDVSDASRPIKDEEAAACAEAGIEYVELKVAYDGMAVMTSVDNTDVSCVSFADIYALVGPESTGFTKWTDAAAIAGELGSTTTFPDLDLVITGPGEESGTFDSFVEIVIAGIAEDRGQDGTTRPDYQSSANDNVIIEGITGNTGSFGWVGLAFAEENKGTVKELGVAKEVNGTCVQPSAETVSDGSYPVSRPLFIYVKKDSWSKPEVAEWVDFYLAEGTISTVLEAVPYVNLPADELGATRAAWEGR